MVFIRMSILSKIFTKNELNALDDPVPRFADVFRPSVSSGEEMTAGTAKFHLTEDPENGNLLLPPNGHRSNHKNRPPMEVRFKGGKISNESQQ